tara:strand:- start:3473 stop:4837 length:1365 start_codon:yes stop_codon:yes gene_type:complete
MSYETNPIGSEQSSSVQFISASLKSSSAVGSVDITSVIMEVSLFENISRPYITGYITVVDSERVIDNMDIQGAEEIELIFKRSTDIQNVKQIKNNFIVQKIEKQYKTNEFTSVVVLRVIDREAFRSGLHNVNRAYTGQPFQIINDIMLDYFDREDLQTSATDDMSNSMRVIVPNMNPIETTQWIRDRALNQNGYPFYFYKSAMTGEYFFSDLETLLSQPVINESQPFVDHEGASSSITVSRDSVIKKMSVPAADNLYDMMQKGVVGSQQRYYDVTTGDFNIVDFNINNDLLVDLQSLNQRQQRPLIDGLLAFEDKSISNYQSKVFSQISAGNVFNDVKSYDEGIDVGDDRKKIKSNALKALLTKSRIKIIVDGDNFIHGDNHYGVGNNVKILIRAKQEISDRARIDKKQSGDYLIMSANYVMEGTTNKVKMVLECAKVGNYQSDTYKPVGGGGR